VTKVARMLLTLINTIIALPSLMGSRAFPALGYHCTSRAKFAGPNIKLPRNGSSQSGLRRSLTALALSNTFRLVPSLRAIRDSRSRIQPLFLSEYSFPEKFYGSRPQADRRTSSCPRLLACQGVHLGSVSLIWTNMPSASSEW